MSSKDISNMLDDLIAHEILIRQRASNNGRKIAPNNLNDRDKAISEQFGSDDGFDIYERTSKLNLELSNGINEEKQFHDISKMNEMAKMDIVNQELVSINSPAGSNIPEDSKTISRGVSFCDLAPKTIFYDDDAPFSVDSPIDEEERVPKDPLSFKSILKNPISDTLPCEVPMEPEIMESSSNDEVSSVSDTSQSEDESDQDKQQEMPSDQEDEDIDIINDEIDEKQSLRKNNFGWCEMTLPIDKVEDSFSNQMKTLISKKLSSSEIKTAPIFEKSEIIKNASSPVFLYFGQSSNNTTSISYIPTNYNQKNAQNPSLVTNTQNITIKESSERLPCSEDSEDDDDTPLMQTLLANESVPSTQALIAKLNEGNLRKITTRVYIQTPQYYQTKTVTSIMRAEQIQQDVIATCLAQGDVIIDYTWSLFELNSDRGIERPIRNWEIVTDIMSAWGDSTTNVLIMKKYGYQSNLSIMNIKGVYPKIQGFTYLQLSPGKWQKRFLKLYNHKLYYLENQKNPESLTLLCSLSNYDIYTLIKPLRKAPSQNFFALRSDMNESLFSDNQNQYIKYICVEKEIRLIDWVLALRMAKSERMIEISKNPELENEDSLLNQPSPLNRMTKGKRSEGSSEQEPDRKLTPGSLLENLNSTFKKPSSSNKSSTSKSKKRQSR